MNEKSKKPEVRSATRLGLVDICANDDGSPCFLSLRDGSFIVEDIIETEDAIIKPPLKSSMPWLLPSAKKVIDFYEKDDDKTLLNDIKAAIQSNVELPSEELYSFFAAWVLHTHIIEKFNHSPIVVLYAVKERGKSRLGKILTWMGRRGIHTETIREADIIRKADRFECIFFFCHNSILPAETDVTDCFISFNYLF